MKLKHRNKIYYDRVYNNPIKIILLPLVIISVTSLLSISIESYIIESYIIGPIDLEIMLRYEEPYILRNYTNLFEIKNNQYYNNKIAINVSVEYQIYYSNYRAISNSSLKNIEHQIVSQNISIKNLKTRKYSGLGNFEPTEYGEYLICAQIIPINESYINQDINISNNQLCKRINIEKNKVFCDYSPAIELLEESGIFISTARFKTILKEESLPRIISNFNLSIPNLNNNTNLTSQNHSTISFIPDYSIEYWITDLNGNILKKKMNTSSSSIKEFTIKQINPVPIIINSKINQINCINRNVKNNITSKIIAAIFPEEKNKEQPEEIKIKDIRPINENNLLIKFNILKLPENSREYRIYITSEEQKLNNYHDKYTKDINSKKTSDIFEFDIKCEVCEIEISHVFSFNFSKNNCINNLSTINIIIDSNNLNYNKQGGQNKTTFLTKISCKSKLPIQESNIQSNEIINSDNDTVDYITKNITKDYITKDHITKIQNESKINLYENEFNLSESNSFNFSGYAIKTEKSVANYKKELPRNNHTENNTYFKNNEQNKTENIINSLWIKITGRIVVLPVFIGIIIVGILLVKTA